MLFRMYDLPAKLEDKQWDTHVSMAKHKTPEIKRNAPDHFNPLISKFIRVSWKILVDASYRRAI